MKEMIKVLIIAAFAVFSTSVVAGTDDHPVWCESCGLDIRKHNITWTGVFEAMHGRCATSIFKEDNITFHNYYGGDKECNFAEFRTGTVKDGSLKNAEVGILTFYGKDIESFNFNMTHFTSHTYNVNKSMHTFNVNAFIPKEGAIVAMGHCTVEMFQDIIDNILCEVKVFGDDTLLFKVKIAPARSRYYVPHNGKDGSVMVY